MASTANNTENVSYGKFKPGGYFFVAPYGTTLPTDNTSALDPAFLNMGFLSDDGITFDSSVSTNTGQDANGDTIATSAGAPEKSFQTTFREIKKDTMAVVYGLDNVTDEDGVLTVHDKGPNNSTAPSWASPSRGPSCSTTSWATTTSTTSTAPRPPLAVNSDGGQEDGPQGHHRRGGRHQRHGRGRPGGRLRAHRVRHDHGGRVGARGGPQPRLLQAQPHPARRRLRPRYGRAPRRERPNGGRLPRDAVASFMARVIAGVAEAKNS